MILDSVLVAAILAALWWLFWPEPEAGAAESDWRRSLSRLGGATSRRLRGYYATMVRQAGLDPGAWRSTYWGAKLAGAALFPLLILEILAALGRPDSGGWWLLAVAVAGAALPDLWLAGARRRRRRRIERSLPYFLDLVVAFLLSGINLTAAFRRAGREGFPDPHPLAWEVALVGRELDAGKSPSVALRDLADRTGVAEFKAVAAALRMGLRIGASVQDTLRAQADAMWTRHQEHMLAHLQKAEFKMSFPALLMGFPMLAVLAFFPVVTELLEVISWLIE